MKTSFGRFLNELRKDKGVGLRAAARSLKISPSYLSKIEQDQVQPPRREIMEKIARYYRIPVDPLINRTPVNRRYQEIRKQTENKTNKAELYALYRAVQDIDPELVFEIMKQLYEKQGKSEEELHADLERLRAELPRLSKGREQLLADRLKPRYLSKKQLSLMAESVLNHFDISMGSYEPPTPIENIVEGTAKVNLILSDRWDGIKPEQEPTVLGMSRWSRTQPDEREIIISAKLFESSKGLMRVRLNFTLAHEYFHAIEHLPLMQPKDKSHVLNRTSVLSPQLSPSANNIKPSIRKIRLQKWVNDGSGPRRLTSDEDWREWQSNYFAACLLMPAKALKKEFQERFGCCYLATPSDMNLRQYAFEVATTIVTPQYVCEKSLCSLFDISAQAMAIRLLQLNLVVKDQE